jgi:metal-responsive CopG/Arc/MetJ family transcriptional regulator
MKTAISLPDRLYEEAEETAKGMGIPRSQLFAKALEEFIEHHKRERITEELNEVYGNLSDNSSLDINEISLLKMRELTQNDSW